MKTFLEVMENKVERSAVRSVVNFLFDNMEDSLDRGSLTLLVADFATKHNIVAMDNYLLWSRNHDEPFSRVLATIIHDLNGRDDSFFLPRTASYENIFETTDQYWDCECDVNYIHKRGDKNYCKFCRVFEYEQPDSRVNEVLAYGFEIEENDND